MSRQAIGIDFGTTFSSVSFLQLGSPDAPVLQQFTGARYHVPTMLQLDPDDRSVVEWGWDAHASLRKSSGNPVVRDFKRMLGAEDDARRWVTAYLRALESTVRDQKGRLTQLSEEEFLTVIGVPANWEEEKAELIRHIAKEVGFPDVRIVTEPVAAMHNLRCQASHFRFGDRPETFMVIDFGGGTLDICVVKTQELGRNPEILSVEGDSMLGGIDFDELIEKWFLRQNDLDREQLSDRDKSYLREQIQDAKENMSIMFRGDGENLVFTRRFHLETGDYQFEATKHGFENRCREAGYFEKISGAVSRALKKCDLVSKDIKRVILTGGSSKWFFVRQIVAKEMGLGDPEELVETETPYTDVAGGLAVIFGRSDEPPPRPGVWLQYTLANSPEETKTLISPARTRSITNDRLYLGDIEVSRIFFSKKIQLEWLSGDTQSKATSLGAAMVKVFLRSNHPKLKKARNVIRVLKSEPTDELVDVYKIYMVTNEDPMVDGVKYKIEIQDSHDKEMSFQVRPGEFIKTSWGGLGKMIRTDYSSVPVKKTAKSGKGRTKVKRRKKNEK